MENLNTKAWYRGIKVFFFIGFICVQLLGFLFVSEKTDRKVIDPSSFAETGRLIKMKFPEYSDISDEIVGSTVYEKVIKELDFETIEELQARGLEIIDLFEYMDKYSIIEKIGFYILSFIIISFVFWIISRIFFYIISGEQFIKEFKIK